MKVAVVALCLLVAVSASPAPQIADGGSKAQSAQGQTFGLQIQSGGAESGVSITIC